MRYQVELGDVDFITGDYLAEVNIAENAQAHAAGQHPGWEQTAWDGIEQTINLLHEKKIKVVINGGAHNPRGLAEKVQELVSNSIYQAYFLQICANVNPGHEQKLQPQSRICVR